VITHPIAAPLPKLNFCSSCSDKQPVKIAQKSQATGVMMIGCES
jgi:hypothetical protein